MLTSFGTFVHKCRSSRENGENAVTAVREGVTGLRDLTLQQQHSKTNITCKKVLSVPPEVQSVVDMVDATL